MVRFQILLELVAIAAVASADTVYITNLPIYKALAPCASNAVSYVVQGLTANKCPPAVTQLQSCACTQDQNSGAIDSSMKTQVGYSCGTTATDDVASASAVFSAYCNQATTVAVPTPTAGAVSKYITDLPAFSDLGPCAGSALSYLVQSLTGAKCPSGASALESCACTKGQISLAISESLSTYVSYSCGSSHSQDITSAQAVFAGYCGMAAGSSSFPTPSALAGQVTYYITDLPIYSSLAKCAQSAVSYPIQAQTHYDCPSGPNALVSCICAKDNNLDVASSSIKTSVSYNCGSTASADITSAWSVLDYYCSAGNGLVTPVGVTASVTTTAYGGNTKVTTTSKANAAGGGAGAGSTPTNTGAGAGATSGTDITTSGTINGTPVAAIAGGVGGAVIFIIFLLFVGCKYRQTQKRKKAAAAIANGNGLDSPPPPFPSEVELPTNQARRKPIPKKPNPSTVTTPVSPFDQTEVAELGPAPTRFERMRRAVGTPKRKDPPPVEMSATNPTNGHNGPWFEMHVP